MVATFFGLESQEPIRQDKVLEYFADDDGAEGAVFSLYTREGAMDFSPDSLLEWHCAYKYYYYGGGEGDIAELDLDRCADYVTNFYPTID